MSRALTPEPGPRTAAVLTLHPVEVLRMEYQVVARQAAMCGPRATSDWICRVADELALALDALSSAHADCAFDLMVGLDRQIRRLAEDVGLPHLRTAADHVDDCLAQRDGTALAATVARLRRVGQLALSRMSAMRLPGC